MIYGGRLRNKAFTDRIKSVAPCFDRLRKLSASMWHKQLGLRVAVWPKALHHCSHLVFGMHWITKLRSQAMAALHANRAGASPILHLAFTSEPELDPGYFAFWKSFTEFYRQAHKSLALRDWWKDYVVSPPTTKTFGPFGAIARWCDFLHLWLDEDLILHFLAWLAWMALSPTAPLFILSLLLWLIRSSLNASGKALSTSTPRRPNLTTATPVIDVWTARFFRSPSSPMPGASRSGPPSSMCSGMDNFATCAC